MATLAIGHVHVALPCLCSCVLLRFRASKAHTHQTNWTLPLILYASNGTIWKLHSLAKQTQLFVPPCPGFPEIVKCPFQEESFALKLQFLGNTSLGCVSPRRLQKGGDFFMEYFFCVALIKFEIVKILGKSKGGFQVQVVLANTEKNLTHFGRVFAAVGHHFNSGTCNPTKYLMKTKVCM